MPRPAAGWQLRLLGPDTRFGAIRRPGYTDYVWTAVRFEGKRRIQRSSGIAGTSPDQRAEAQRWFAGFLAQEQAAAAAADRSNGAPQPAATMPAAEALALYAEQHAPTTADPGRIGYAVAALTAFLVPAEGEPITVAGLAGRTMRAYADHRRSGDRPVSDSTIDREIATLGAALRWCVREGFLADAPATLWSPDPASPRADWITRDEAARLIRAARRDPRSRHYLPLLILTALYTGQRKGALLTCGLVRNTVGGWIDTGPVARGGRAYADFNRPGARITRKRRARGALPRGLSLLLAARARAGQVWLAEEWRRVEGRGATAVYAPIGIRIANIRRSFASAVEAAGLADLADGRRITPHTLKHTAITWAMQSGMAPTDAAEYFATSLDTIYRHYYHHHPEAGRQAVDHLERRGRQ